MRKFLAVLLCLLLLPIPASAAEGERCVALTFDDGPSGRFTRRLLQGLYDREVSATFLLCGYRMQQFPEITQAIFDQGHEIGLHGYSHRRMTDMSRRAIGQELMDTEALLPQGCRPKFFRPPGGICTDGVRQVAQVRGLAILSWSLDPRDWATQDAAAVEAAVTTRVRDGDVILLHDMSDSSVDAALAIVDQLKGQGFRFLTVSQLAKRRGRRIEPGKTYHHFRPPEEGPGGT